MFGTEKKEAKKDAAAKIDYVIKVEAARTTKNDAIIIVEFKDYEGDLIARQNGDWTCNGKSIKGGNGGKSVFGMVQLQSAIIQIVLG